MLKAFNGEEKLIIAFWLWGVTGNMLFVFLFFLLTLAIRGSLTNSFILPIFFALFQFAYFIVSQIIIWRSAFNTYGNRGWGYVARFVVINSPLTFIIIFAIEYFFLFEINWK